MKRLSGLIGLTLFSVSAVCFYAGLTAAFWIAVGALVLFAVCMLVCRLRQHRGVTVFLAVTALGAVVFCIFTSAFVMPVQQRYSGLTASVDATLCEESYFSYGMYCYELEIVSIDGESVSGKLLLRSAEPLMIEPFTKVSGKLELFASDSPANLSDNIYLTSSIYGEPMLTTEPPESLPPYGHAIRLRAALRTALYSELDSDTAAFASALMLGDKHAMSREATEAFREVGLSHIIVVSGMHLSVIVTALGFVLKRILKKKYIAALITAAVVICFAAVTGFSSSVLRAAIMLCIVIAGSLIGRQGDMLNSLGIAALILTVINPYSAGNIGTMLSFCATLGIILFARRITDALSGFFFRFRLFRCRLFRSAIRFFCGIFAMSVSATAATLPVAVLAFHRVSLVGLVANMLVIPVIELALILIILCAAVSFVPFTGVITDILSFCITWIYRYITDVVNMLGSLSFSSVGTDYVFVCVWLAGVIVLFSAAAMLGRGRRLCFAAALMSVLIFASGSLSGYLVRKNYVTLCIAGSSSVNAVFVYSDSANAVLSCGRGNSAYSVGKVLDGLNTSNDLLIVDSDSSLATAAAADMIREFDYSTVLMYDTDSNTADAETVRELTKNCIESSGDRTVRLWDCVKVDVIERGGSIYEYITAGDTSILILPDSGDCSDIDPLLLSPDILIARGMIDSMELLSCGTLFAGGSQLAAEATVYHMGDRAQSIVLCDDTQMIDIDIS